MALPPLALVSDLEERTEETYSGKELSRAKAVLVDASSLVRDEARTTWIATDGSSTAPDVAVTITLRAAERAMRNPDGLISEKTPEYEWRKEGAEDGVYLTEGECRRLRRLAGRSGLWTQPTTRCDRTTNTVWVADQYGCDPLPMYSLDDLA